MLDLHANLRRCLQEIHGRSMPQDSTLAEIAKLILEATTQTEKTEALSGHFTVYELRVDRDGMILCVSVDHRPSSLVGHYMYSLADRRCLLTNAA
jgi:hypothetical protein